MRGINWNRFFWRRDVVCVWRLGVWSLNAEAQPSKSDTGDLELVILLAPHPFNNGYLDLFEPGLPMVPTHSLGEAPSHSLGKTPMVPTPTSLPLFHRGVQRQFYSLSTQTLAHYFPLPDHCWSLFSVCCGLCFFTVQRNVHYIPLKPTVLLLSWL